MHIVLSVTLNKHAKFHASWSSRTGWKFYCKIPLHGFIDADEANKCTVIKNLKYKITFDTRSESYILGTLIYIFPTEIQSYLSVPQESLISIFNGSLNAGKYE